MSDRLSLFASTAPGIEPLLLEELKALGATDLAPVNAGVGFSGDLALAYRVCLWSRTASRVLLHLARFSAKTPEELYAGVQTLDWAQHLDPDGSLAVDFHSARSRIAHSHFGALKVKDAIVDQLRERHGVRPSVDLERPQVRVNVYVLKNEAQLSLDLAGESLHRRGYREQGVAAPLKESLAAAILMYAGWPEAARAGKPLLDPLCGSGTLPIEAALMAGDIAPGLFRTWFGFYRWRGHDPELWSALLDEALERREQGLKNLPVIVGYDLNPAAVRAAKGNVERADLRGHVQIECRPLAQAFPVGQGPGLLVANPPYGERIGAEGGVRELYRELGEVLYARFQGWQASIFTGNPPLLRELGLRFRSSTALKNGPIQCQLAHYQIEGDYSAPPDPERDLKPLDGPLSDGAQSLANRLRKNLKHLGRWARREGVDCWRVYDADLPEYAFAVDLYQSDRLYVHVQEYEAPPTVDPARADQRAREALTVIPQVLEIGPEQLAFKVRRRQRGAEQYRKLGEQEGFIPVREGRCRLWVNLSDYLDTGLFLDHRPVRGMIETEAAGKRFLNLFAYTGAATAHAAVGGATETTTVDLSATYLDWAARNLALNGFEEGPAHRLIQADCTAWLPAAAQDPAERGRYDLVFLDPPTFSNSKRMQDVLDIQRDHVALIRSAVALLAPGGSLIFSTNFRRFRLDAGSLSDLNVEEISRATIPPDFERNPRIHYCWRIRL